MTDRFTFDGETYDLVMFGDLPLRALVTFDRDMQDAFGMSMKWSQFLAMLVADEQSEEDLGIAVIVRYWASLNVGGRKMSLTQVADLPGSAITNLDAESEERPTSARKGGKKKSGTSPSSTQQGSSPVAVLEPSQTDAAAS